jgi:sugar lactone lactonase YvrE
VDRAHPGRPEEPSDKENTMSIQSHTEPQVLLTGLAFPESPRWHEDRLFVSDWGAGEVIATDHRGQSEIIARVPSFPMCIDHLPDGRLLIVDAAERRVLRREIDGSLMIHADLAALGEHPWNDIVVDGRGNAYVNNIGFDFPEGEFAPGIVALVTPDGAVRQVADELAFPNGMVVTPDATTLIVAESYGQRLTAFDIAADGSLSGRRPWAEVDDHPDGICLDAEGAVWYGDEGTSRCVRVRQGGKILQSIQLDRGCFACMLGGRDGRTLFMVTNHWGGAEDSQSDSRKGQVVVAEAPAPGAGWP